MGEDEGDDRERKDEKVGEERKKRWERMTNKMPGVMVLPNWRCWNNGWEWI